MKYFNGLWYRQYMIKWTRTSILSTYIGIIVHFEALSCSLFVLQNSFNANNDIETCSYVNLPKVQCPAWVRILSNIFNNCIWIFKIKWQMHCVIQYAPENHIRHWIMLNCFRDWERNIWFSFGMCIYVNRRHALNPIYRKSMENGRSSGDATFLCWYFC